MLFLTTVSKNIVQQLNDILNSEKNLNNKCLQFSTTVKGFQTDTIHSNPNYQNLILNLLYCLPIKNFKCKWFHLIDYEQGGWQDEHDHAETEDYSFILYLTTCINGGKTMFRMSNKKLIYCSPVEGKLILFPANLSHWAEKTIDVKKVAVGALVVNKH